VKEISSLASWTVSSSKPGCGVPQLRSPSTASFWQSDGPQPHHLNIHFFKVVEIAAMRLYLDFDQDESYTPTKLAFLAGMGEMDLQEWAVMSLAEPRGWVNVDFEGRLPVLRAMLVQVRILENHQNGKDTHLRGLQIFAKDKMSREKKMSAANAAAISGVGSKKRAKIIHDLGFPEPELR
ncbi:anaphase-promoting complex, subunit 10/DOC domain-containing protein, partial [Phyllosticta capitalensis]